MPRPAKGTGRRLGTSTLVVDNGAHTLKAGFVNHSDPLAARDCHVIPNCIARGMDGPRSSRVYIADQLDDCRDFAEMTFKRPVEKGFIVNWETESDIWKHVFFQPNSKLYCDPHDTNLVLSEAPNCPAALQHNTDQILFEEFEFASACRTLAPALTANNDTASLFGEPRAPKSMAECLLVVDSGYSHTTVTPLYKGQPIQSAIRRLEVGGKFLTNRLKELVSLRQFNLMDDSHLVEQIKEDVSFVSQNFNEDLDWVQRLRNPAKHVPSANGSSSREPLVIEYVLPDYHDTLRGHSRPYTPQRHGNLSQSHNQKSAEDALTLGNERFGPPELLFTPRDIQLAQAGLPEILVQTVESLPSGMWPAMLANVLVVGGTTSLPGFMDRLQADLQSLVPAECAVRVRRPPDPLTYTWLGGARMAASVDNLKTRAVTREEYQEHGSTWTARKFRASALNNDG